MALPLYILFLTAIVALFSSFNAKRINEIVIATVIGFVLMVLATVLVKLAAAATIGELMRVEGRFDPFYNRPSQVQLLFTFALKVLVDFGPASLICAIFWWLSRR